MSTGCYRRFWLVHLWYTSVLWHAPATCGGCGEHQREACGALQRPERLVVRVQQQVARLPLQHWAYNRLDVQQRAVCRDGIVGSVGICCGARAGSERS